MIKMNLSEISMACGGRLVSEKDKQIEITGIVTDSRKAAPGCLFAAILGARTDGHKFIDTAFKAGACAVLCEKAPEDSEVPYILTGSTLKALQDIAAYMLEKAGISVVGISGSVGKTSTKEAIASVLSQKYSVLKTEGNYNNELGLPLTVFNLEEEHAVAVLEMGICDFGEMHTLASIAKPDICVLTNIGDCHLENLKDRAGVFKAKTEIFDFLKDSGHIVLNGDDDYLSSVKEVNGIKPVFYGLDESNDVWADNIRECGFEGISCDIHIGDGAISVFIRKPGVHMVYNALAAAAVGHIMGLPDEEIKSGIESQKSVGGRFNIIRTGDFTVIDDCYNANPMSMKASLESLNRADTRKVAVLGDMGELGDEEEELHAQVGEFAASLDLDVLVCIGDLSANIAKKALANSKLNTAVFKDVESFLRKKDEYISSGDTVLVKASHFMNFGTIVDALTAGSPKKSGG